MRKPPHRTGFTLVEVLVTLTIISVLAGVTYPMVKSAVRTSRKVACLNNLRQIGIGLEAYLQDNNQRMPVLEAGRRSPEEDVPVLEILLRPYLDRADVFHCPADKKVHASSGSSYLWNTTQNGLHRSKLAFFGSKGDPSKIPLVIDKEAWHQGSETGSNFLYADYSVSNRIQFSVSP